MQKKSLSSFVGMAWLVEVVGKGWAIVRFENSEKWREIGGEIGYRKHTSKSRFDFFQCLYPMNVRVRIATKTPVMRVTIVIISTLLLRS